MIYDFSANHLALASQLRSLSQGGRLFCCPHHYLVLVVLWVVVGYVEIYPFYFSMPIVILPVQLFR